MVNWLADGRKKILGSLLGGGEDFSLPPGTKPFWGRNMLLSKMYRGPFPLKQNGRSVTITGHPHRMNKFKNKYRHSPTTRPRITVK
jgi:hypothetical protein